MAGPGVVPVPALALAAAAAAAGDGRSAGSRSGGRPAVSVDWQERRISEIYKTAVTPLDRDRAAYGRTQRK